jgi:hypothetical protein
MQRFFSGVSPFLGFALLAAASVPLVAQTQTATLRGAVKDPAGAVVPNATLILTNLAQNRPLEGRSNDSGEYVFVQIPPGRYSLQVTSTGFKKFLQPEFTLEVAQVAAFDVTLEIGAATEIVEVRGEAPLLDAATSTLGEVVNALTTESLPLNGRNVMQLVALTPGINTTPSYRTNTVGSGTIAANGFSANGGRDVSNSILVDGSPQEVMGYNQPAFVPNPDAVQEFKVQTNNLSAEYGRTGGAVVNVVTRSGGKEFHGVLFHFLRNNVLDASGFFNNLNGRGKGPFRFNQFGGTLGGPITPARNRSFFFFSYEGVRQVNPGSSFFSLPTARMRTGDFGEINNLIYDPLTINADGARQPFADRRIPAARITRGGAGLVSYYPLPTLPGVQNNFFSQASSRPTDNAYSARIDHRFTDRHNIYGRISWNDRGIVQPNHFQNLASPNAGQDGSVNRSATIDDTILLGNWVLHANMGYAFAANPRSSPDEAFSLTSLGLPATVDAARQFAVFPRIDPAGYGVLGGEPSFIIGNKFETYNTNADASRLFGSHTIKFGGTYRLNKSSNFRPIAPGGQFTFNENWTRQFFNRAGGGDSIASMLIGAVGGGRLQQEPRVGLTVPYYALYLQDDWRVNSKLTLNLGLRWDSDRPLREMHDRTSWFDFDAQLPINPPGLGPIRGGLVFANRNGTPRANKNPDNNNFAPRVGLAYQINSRFVIRSGFGVFFNPTTGTGPSAGNSGALSYNANTPIVVSNDGGRTQAATLANPFPNGFNVPENGALGLLTFLGQGTNAIVRGDRTPYSMQWNFNVQYQLKNSQLIDVAYAGNSGVKLLAQSNFNQLPDQFLALGDQLNDVVDNPFFGIAPATSPLGARTTTRGQLLRPFPQFGDVTHIWGSQAHSSYHALQAKFRQRFSNGLQFLMAYTFSKILDDTSSVAGFLGQANPDYTNNNRKDLDKSISGLHTANRAVANFQYELPFGRKNRHWTRYLIGGWSANGVVTLQSGVPITVSSIQNQIFSYGGDARPDTILPNTATSGSIKERYNRWLNPAAFTDAARFRFGTVGRFLPDTFGPPLFSTDMSILKNITVNERVRLQFRSEFFNFFNQVNFSNPASTAFGLTPTGQLARPDFGRITGSGPARVIQFGLKLYY